jgi:hypothetical protein
LAAIRTDGWHCFGLPGQICRRRTGGWHQLDLGNLTGGTSLAGFGLAEQKLRVAPSWYRVDGHGIEEWHLLLRSGTYCSRMMPSNWRVALFRACRLTLLETNRRVAPVGARDHGWHQLAPPD